MNDFEYLFSFYALLLGLSIANVASGFGDIWRERRVMPAGICPPLLGLVVLVGGMNIWVRYWHTQHDVQFNPLWLLSAAGVTIPFIFVSRAMFPAASEPQSLEDHYLAQRKVLLIALAVRPAFPLFRTCCWEANPTPDGPRHGWRCGSRRHWSLFASTAVSFSASGCRCLSHCW